MTWYIGAMDAARLHFPGQDTEPLRLLPGTHLVGWRDERLGAVSGPGQALLTVQVSQRDLWLHVSAHMAPCVHVNGRRVHRIALLRSGDVVHVESAELRLISEPRPHAPEPVPPYESHDPCPLLRGLNGQHHGRCFTLDRPHWIGRGVRADIQIDEPGWGERQLRLERVQDQIILHNPGAGDDALVNGHPLREAVLTAGDQLVLGRRHRFVLEVPQAGARPSPPPDHRTMPQRQPPISRTRGLWPLWLLAAAAVLAAALAALLLFGTAM